MRAIFLSLMVLALSAAMGWAQNTAAPVFFEALYDVPAMPGLEEVKDQAVLFDKPGGRIASVVAASKTLNAAQIVDFYDESLPQLGWKKTSQNQYVRGKDLLTMELTKAPPLTVVHFMLSPDAR